MAPALLNFTLPAAVLCTVVIPGLQDFNIANPSSRVTELPQQSRVATLPDGYVAYPDIGAAYKVYNVRIKWTSARKQCISEGAHLAVIDTNVKLDLLMPHLEAERTWTDIHKMHRDTEWVSSNSDLPMRTLPWASDEPSGDNYCVAASTSPRGLRNFYCINDYPYVCELPIPENYNGQGIYGTVNITAN